VVLRRLIDDRTVKQIVCIDLEPPTLVSGKLRWEKVDIREPRSPRLSRRGGAVSLRVVVSTHMPRHEMDAINVGGSKNVCTAAVARGVKKIVYSSSVAAYGVVPGHSLPLSEDSPRKYQADFAYSANKYLVEEFLDELEKAHPEASVVRLRPRSCWGRG